MYHSPLSIPYIPPRHPRSHHSVRPLTYRVLLVIIFASLSFAHSGFEHASFAHSNLFARAEFFVAKSPIKRRHTSQYPVLLTRDPYDSNSSVFFASLIPAAAETADVGMLRPSRLAIPDLASLAALRSLSHSEHVSKSSTSSYTAFRKGFHSRRGIKQTGVGVSQM